MLSNISDTGVKLLYYVFILRAISPCTTGLKELYDPFHVQVQSNFQITDIPLTKRQRLKDDLLSMYLRFFNLQMGIGPNDRGLPLEVVIRLTMYLPVPGIEPTSSVFLGECVTH